MQKQSKKLIEHFNNQKVDLLNEIKGGDITCERTLVTIYYPDHTWDSYFVTDRKATGGLHGLMGAGIP